MEALAESGRTVSVLRLGWPDQFIAHATDVKTLRAAYGLSPEQCLEKALQRWRELRGA